MSTITTPLLTAGWFRAMRTTLGLSIEQMADILDVRDDTIRKAWEGGETRIPAGVRDEIAGLIEDTNNATKYLATRAANFVYPCIIAPFSTSRWTHRGHHGTGIVSRVA